MFKVTWISSLKCACKGKKIVVIGIIQKKFPPPMAHL